LVPLV
jgi:hypothetical protein